MNNNHTPTKTQSTPQLFDVIVGNPPWGAEFDQKTKDYIFANYETSEYQLDSYVSFIERGLDLLKDDGYISFIVPSTWLNMHYFQKIRRKIIFETELKEVVLFTYQVFEDATVETCIFVCKKCNPNPNNQIQLTVADQPEDLKTKPKTSITQKLWQENYLNGFNPFFDETKYTQVQKMFDSSILLDQVVVVKNGIKPYEIGKGIPKQNSNDVKNRIYDNESKLDKNYKEYIVGGDFKKYNIEIQRHKYIKYGENLAAPRNFDFTQDKIIIRQTSDKIIATHDTQGFLNLNNVHNLIPKPESRYNLKYILGVLNSQTIDLVYKFLVPEAGRVFAEVKAVNLAKLPIPNATPEQQTEIATLVDQIMELKTQYSKYLDNTFKLLQAELASSSPILPTINRTKNLTKFTELDFTTFLAELTKQKFVITPAVKRTLLESFEIDKARLEELQNQIIGVDNEIESRVRRLYGVE